jgi:hypothetical protein
MAARKECKMIKSLVIALATGAAALGASSAQAHVYWSVGVNVPVPAVYAPAYAPGYVSAPVVVSAPVGVYPAYSYYRRPYAYGPAFYPRYAPVYRPGYGYWGGRRWR